MKQYSPDEIKLLTQVLPNVATQLRGEMTNIYTAARHLVSPETREKNAEIDKLAAVFSQSYYQMYRIIGNLTDASWLAETGKFMLFNDDIVGLCRTVCEKAELLFSQNGINLCFSADTASLVIGMDAGKTERLLLNLLSNALKFTPPGGEVSVKVRADEKFVRLIVSDTGCGIAPDKMDVIFESFLHEERADAASHGLGLGLALCRRIAQGHGGMIAAESEQGKGAAFTVSFPNVRSENSRVRETRMDYAGGFNPVLIQLSDALRPDMFLQKYTD